jgi:hypothetical protein
MKNSKILFALTAASLAIAGYANAASTPAPTPTPAPAYPIVLAENFDNVGQLAGNGWLSINASANAGQGWFQGNDGVFAAHSGAANSYIAADFSSTTSPVGSIDNWLITPTLNLNGVSTLTFFTRTADAGFNDKLEVRFSRGNSGSVSSFTTLVTTVGGNATYPDSGFQQFTATLPASGTGRIAFRYVGNGADADYIGIDTVRVAAVPEPSTYAMMGLGLAALALARRKSKKA